MDLTGGDNDGLIQAKGSPRIPRRKKGRRGTQYHQNNSVGHSSHRSSSRSSQKRRSGTEVHNTAGRRRPWNNKIKIPTAPCAATLYDIYSDDSPNHRGRSVNSRGRMPRYTENDSSDSSRLSTAAQTNNDDIQQQKQRRKCEKGKKQQQLDKERKKKQHTIDKLAENKRIKTASEGSREIEAARKRLAAAKTQVSMARTMLNAAKKEEREATEMLKDAEKRWEVIDID